MFVYINTSLKLIWNINDLVNFQTNFFNTSIIFNLAILSKVNLIYIVSNVFS